MSADLLARAAELIDVASVSYHECEIADLIEERLSAVTGLTVDRVGDNVVARTDLSRPLRVLIGGHSDTVPPNDNAAARIEGDVLWGLGAADMKSALAVMLELAAAVAEPAVDVTWLFYAREEVRVADSGLRELFDVRPDLLAADVALLGEPTGGAVEAGCQGSMRAVVTLAGAPGPHRPALDGGQRHPPAGIGAPAGRGIRTPHAGDRRLPVPGVASGGCGGGRSGRKRGARPSPR